MKSVFMLLIAFCLFAYTATAQTGNVIAKVKQVNSTVSQAKTTATETTAFLKETLQTSKTAGTILKSLLGRKKEKNQVILLIPDISPDNPLLITLKSAISNIKGVKELNAEFKNGSSALHIKSKSSASGIWESISVDAKSGFTLSEMEEGMILLQVNKSI